MDFKKYLTPCNIGIGFVIVMFFIRNVISGGLSHKMEYFLVSIPGLLIGIAFHEFAHAVTAYKLGDSTPKFMGRVTINPFKHLDLFGLFALIFLGFGWGKPVMINPNNFKNRRRDELIVSLAGVTTNLIIAIVFSIIYRIISTATNSVFYQNDMMGTFLYIIYVAIYINVILMVFNLIPIPPLDGFNAVTEIFNLRKYDWYWQIYDKGFIFLIIFLVLGLADNIIVPICQYIISCLNLIGQFVPMS